MTREQHAAARLLRDLRERRRLSRPQLASAARVSPAAVKAYEAGRRRPKFDTTVRLLRSLGANRGEIAAAAAELGYHPASLRASVRQGTARLSPNGAPRR